MNLGEFSHFLRGQIISTFQQFRADIPREHPYGMAILGQPLSWGLCIAIATEEGLTEVARRYEKAGYRVVVDDNQALDHLHHLKAWLRWAHPDDGWRYRNFPDQTQITDALRHLYASESFGRDAEHYEEFLVTILKNLNADETWLQLTSGLDVICGYCDSDPEQFLYSATCANPFHLVGRIQREKFAGDAEEKRIIRPRRIES